MSNFDWKDEDCDAVEALLIKLSSKHALPILAILAIRGRRSFGQLGRDLAPISPKVLSGCLMHLHKHGFIKNEKEMHGRVQRSYYSIVQRDKFIDVFTTFREVTRLP